MLEGRHIVLVEDDEIMGASLNQRLELEGVRVIWYRTMRRALGALRTPRHPIDVVICDIRLPDGSGEDLFYRLCEYGTPPPFLFMTGQSAADQAVRLLQSGAADYLTKPFEMAQFLERVSHVIAPLRQSEVETWFGVSSMARALEADVDRIAARDEPVLITGETGTGKRMIARRIHACSDRNSAPFVSVDLTRLEIGEMHGRILDPETGGLVRAADGVLLLERISSAPDALQRQILEHLWGWAGGGARIIATDGPDPGANASSGAIRRDLYFFLSALSLQVPPLRKRPEDAVWLMSRLFEAMNARRETPLRGISALAEEAVLSHDWPGNGRELRARLTRAMAMTSGETIFPADLFPEIIQADTLADDMFAPLAEARDEVERVHIRRALDRCGGNLTEAAKLLRIGRSTLWEKMQKLGV